MTVRRFAVVLAALLLAGCAGGANRLHSGTVVDKHYDDPDTFTIWQCAGFDSKGQCTVRYPQTITEPAHWSIRVKGTDAEGKARTEWHTVDEATYERLHVGDTWEES